MEYTVLIQPKRSGFTAMIPALPDCRANGKTEQEAIDKIRGKIQQFLAKNKIVMLSLPENGHDHEEDPWLAMAGMWRDDPTFDEFQKIVEKFRKRPKLANKRNSI